jgi:hypothetical protein
MKKGLIYILSAFVMVSLYAQDTDGMELKFSDDFTNNKNGWFTSMEGTNRSRINFNEEFLVIAINQKGASDQAYVNSKVDFNSDFVFKASIKSETDVTKEEVTYGFYLGLSDWKLRKEQGWYAFKLFSNERKAWIYASMNDGKKLFERNATDGPSFRASDYNEIAIARKGDMVYFYINGKEVYNNDVTRVNGDMIFFEATNLQKANIKKIEIYQ